MPGEQVRSLIAARIIGHPHPNSAPVVAAHHTITGRRCGHGTQDRLVTTKLRHRVVELSCETVEFNRPSRDHLGNHPRNLLEQPRPFQQAGGNGNIPSVGSRCRPLHGRVVGFLLLAHTIPLGKKFLMPCAT